MTNSLIVAFETNLHIDCGSHIFLDSESQGFYLIPKRSFDLSTATNLYPSDDRDLNYLSFKGSYSPLS